MDKYFLNKKKITCTDTKEVCHGYSEYLATEHWKKFRLSVIKSRKTCECCGKSYEIMNVHHITYNSLGNEKPKDVALLCIDCHKFIHDIKRGIATCGDKRILLLVKKPKKKKSKLKAQHKNQKSKKSKPNIDNLCKLLYNE